MLKSLCKHLLPLVWTNVIPYYQAVPKKSLNTLKLSQNAAVRGLTGTRKISHLSCAIFSLLALCKIKTAIQNHLPYVQSPKRPTCRIVKTLQYSHPNPGPRNQAYFLFLESPNVEWEAEPSVIRLLYWGQTSSPRLRVGWKPSFLI